MRCESRHCSSPLQMHELQARHMAAIEDGSACLCAGKAGCGQALVWYEVEACEHAYMLCMMYAPYGLLKQVTPVGLVLSLLLHSIQYSSLQVLSGSIVCRTDSYSVAKSQEQCLHALDTSYMLSLATASLRLAENWQSCIHAPGHAGTLGTLSMPEIAACEPPC